jgi:hypothetical protein
LLWHWISAGWVFTRKGMAGLYTLMLTPKGNRFSGRTNRRSFGNRIYGEKDIND